eukprot:gene5748-7937_t
MFWIQLKSILYKNWLLKRAHIAGFAAELLLPVLFLCLLILIKSITDVYDSPDIAYYCGNTAPWYYSSSLSDFNIFDPLSSPPIGCTQKPLTCDTDKYYQDVVNYNFEYENQTLFASAYTQYGYVSSGLTSGSSNNPFYSFTIGDEADIYYELDFYNPSLSIHEILSRISTQNSLFAIASSSNDESLQVVSDMLRQYILNITSSNYTDTVVTFSSQSALNSYIKSKSYDNVGFNKIAFAVIWNTADIASAQWDYSLRVNYTGPFESNDPTVACLYGGKHSCPFTYTIPSTKFYTADLFKPQSTEFMFGYSYSGFATIQQVVDAFIFSQYSQNAVDITASVSMMPTSAYKTDNFQYVISSTLGIFYMLSFLYPVSRIIRSLVVEKETRIKEGMKIMGVSDTVYNLSWLITTVLQMTIVSILITLVTGGSVFEYSNKVYVFIYFEVFSLAVINLCFLCATFFSRSKTASLLGPMIFFASYFPFYAVNDPQFSTSAKSATCLLAPACFALGATVFADYEGGLVGIQSSNVNQTTSNFSYNLCVGIMFLDALLYGFAAWYFDKVLPSEYGTQLPFYFPLLPSYWCGCDSYDPIKIINSYIFGIKYSALPTNDSEPLVTGSLLEEGLIGVNNKSNDINSKYFEDVSQDLTQQLMDNKCVSIKKLRKVFKSAAGGDDRIAVNNLNLDLYQGQVTVLLGHNGAGKTTTISMLVGLIPPSSGGAVMPGGLELNENLQEIRRNLGVCPQHDILFPELTVMQHLEMYAAFKGVPSDQITSESKRMIAEVGLKEKANAKSSTLSGGQKRKLSLGIALIGDSKVVILDEPTSGMDPYSRRSTWNIIQRNKKGRVILLTTHFMDEADLLGDRIAIMAHGKLQCVGSSLFLKNRFGVGYTLTIVKQSQEKQSKEILFEISSKITSVVTKHIPEAQVLSDVGAEQSFRLPFEASSRFVRLFSELDEAKAESSIQEYGISVTTLEEVFIRVGEIEDVSTPVDNNADLSQDEPANHANNTGMIDLVKNVSGSRNGSTPVKEEYVGYGESSSSPLMNKQSDQSSNLFVKHFVALFIKRAIYAKRDRRMLVCQLVLPVLLVIAGLSLLLIRPNLSQPSLILSPASQFNTHLSEEFQNFVPFGVNGALSGFPIALQERFNGNENDGVFGVAVPINGSLALENEVDPFGSCSVGAEVLFNMSRFLLEDELSLHNEKGSSRYGAVTISADTNESSLQYNIMVNSSAMHGVGLYANQVHTAFLQLLSGVSSATITIRNFPLPRTVSEDSQANQLSAFVVALFCMIAFCFIPASFATFIVKEREVKAKHQQVISGVSIYAYWLSTYTWDIISYLPTAALVIAVMYAYDISSYTEGVGAGATAGLIILFGPAIAAQTYLISFLFVSHSTAQIAVMFFNFVTGLCLMVTSFVLTTIPSTSEISLSLRYLFRLFPSFCLGDGLLQLALCQDGTCPTVNKHGYNFAATQGPLAWDIAGGDITFMAIEMIFFFVFAVLIEYGLTFPALLSWLYAINDPDGSMIDLNGEDEDVAEERKRILSGAANNDVVRICELRKIYPANSRAGGLTLPSLNQVKIKVAVQSLAFGIPNGQCFGFLGINGAGKTTTLSILSGEFPPTSGTAFIDGYDIRDDQSNIRRKIGYCPQFDALLELLTVREHLELYGRIKGLYGEELDRLVTYKINQLDLKDFSNKLAGSLSGGNKRKLSVAIATIGNPSIVFLDEPSTGMDPVARRFMWRVIAKMSTQDAQCSVILTTHSMEEAEALCTRIGVMVNGRLRCLGSSQHLKERFGDGFEVNIKTAMPSIQQMLKVAQQIVDRKLIDTSMIPVNNPLSRDNKAGSVNSLDVDCLDELFVKESDLPVICNALNNPNRINLIHPTQSGAIIHNNMTADNGIVSLKVWADWWVSEDMSDSLQLFMMSSFGGINRNQIELLERSTLQCFRYRIKRSGAVTGVIMSGMHESSSSHGQRRAVLSDIFSAFEENKVRLGVAEYSVGQTTLEQIFNQFAGQQDNPEVNN